MAGLADRPSRPHASPRRTSAEVEAAVAELRREAKLGPARIAARLGVPASTVHRVLTRLGLHRLAFVDRPTARVVRRYERAAPGELGHVDVKKLGRIPDGGGWFAHGRATGTPRGRGLGYDFVHSAVDDFTRRAYAEVLADERKETAAAFWGRAEAWFRDHGIGVERVLTDNGPAYRTGRRPTARWSGSTAPWRRNGPTCGPTPHSRLAPTPLRRGCTPTTITAATPPSEANRR